MTKLIQHFEIHKNLSIESMQNEIWADVFGFEGVYEVSNLGRVKALSIIKRHGRYSHLHKEKILKVKIERRGYLQVTLQHEGNRSYYGVHQLVALAFIPNSENKPTVNHKNGCKSDNVVDNLEWATHKEQINHADSNGLRNVKGSATKKSKLTEEIVFYIRNSYESNTMLALKFNVNRTCIQKARTKLTWNHI